MPTTRHSGRACRSPRADAGDERAVADRDEHDGGSRQVTGVDAGGQLDRHRARAGGDPRVVAVDEKVRPGLDRMGVRRGPGGVEIVADLEDRRAEGLHPGDLAGVRHP
jgi:hypothetical protein